MPMMIDTDISILLPKGKLCIFAHHLDVLDEIARGSGLSNLNESMTKFIRIDGAVSSCVYSSSPSPLRLTKCPHTKTLPKIRQEQILSFQTDPSVRIALLGITVSVDIMTQSLIFCLHLPTT